jgi:Bacterial protein of unknown function (DUF839)
MSNRSVATALAFGVVVALFASGALAKKKPKPVNQPAGLITLPAGYGYTVLSTACTDAVRSTESGGTFPMPEDFDNNQLVKRNDGGWWLINNHELTQPRPGDFQGDVGKCHVDEQSPGDGDSDGWGSVSRLALAKDGVTVTQRELTTTGLHNLCAGLLTPWKSFLTNEEFPFIADPEQRSGWIWEIDPATGAQHRATGMGRFSHEQEARVGNVFIETDDRGNYQYLYKYAPNKARDLEHGKLYGLVFDRATNTGHWVGPLNPLNPEADMISRAGPPTPANSFGKAEGMIKADTGNAVVFSESASGSDPGRVWKLTHVRNATVHGQVLAEGDLARMSRPDNLRYNRHGDLFILEDNGSALGNPATGGVNEIWILPKKQVGSQNLVHFASTKDEPTGPIFSHDNRFLYLSLQGTPSRVLAIQGPKNLNHVPAH